MVSELIDARKALLASGEPAPRDLLTLLLEAADPETGKGLSDIEVRREHRHLHRRRPRDHGQCPVLVALSPLAGRTGPRPDRAGGGRGAGRRAASSPQHLERLVYTRAVIDEAMRLYPPAPFMSRDGHRG